jgi:hypothetical protein
MYLAVVMDLFSRKIVGWAMRATLHTELVVAALDMAQQSRRPGQGLLSQPAGLKPCTLVQVFQMLERARPPGRVEKCEGVGQAVIRSVG